jgi:hypothetical protein
VKPHAKLDVNKHIMKKLIALTFAASTLFLAGCCTAHHTTKWEYQTISGVGIDKINQLANDGWIVVGFSQPQGGGSIVTGYLLKRPKQ